LKYTNTENLPPEIYEWLCADTYDYVDDPYTLSATTLMKPVRAYWLTKRYGDSLSMDILDRLSSKFGDAVHASFSQVQTRNVLKENRVSKSVVINGQPYTLSGKYDILAKENGIWVLKDIKTTSVWSYIFRGKDEDYCKQLSIYRWLLSSDYMIDDTSYIHFIFTDWQSSKAKQDTEGTYPKHKIKANYPVKLMDVSETDDYIMARLQEFHNNREVADDQLPLCTDEELWRTDNQWAVWKQSQKSRAAKVCSSEAEAYQYIRDHDIKGFVQYRPGKVKRCRFCPCHNWCNQFKDLQSKNLIAQDY